MEVDWSCAGSLFGNMSEALLQQEQALHVMRSLVEVAEREWR